MEDEDQFDWTQPAAGKIEKTADKDRRYLLSCYLHMLSQNTVLLIQEENRMPLFISFQHIYICQTLPYILREQTTFKYIVVKNGVKASGD